MFCVTRPASDETGALTLTFTLLQGVTNEFNTTVCKQSRLCGNDACSDCHYIYFARCRADHREEVSMDPLCAFLCVVLVVQLIAGIFKMIDNG